MKDERVYLGHIRDAITDIEEYTSAGRDTFMAERMGFQGIAQLTPSALVATWLESHPLRFAVS